MEPFVLLAFPPPPPPNFIAFFVSKMAMFALEPQRARRGILTPRGKNCRETIFAAQLPRNYPHHGVNFERGKNVRSWGGEAIWEAF